MFCAGKNWLNPIQKYKHTQTEITLQSMTEIPTEVNQCSKFISSVSIQCYRLNGYLIVCVVCLQQSYSVYFAFY